MNLYNDLVLKFEKPDWSKNPEFGVFDTILELHPEIYHIFKSDIIGNVNISVFGKKDKSEPLKAPLADSTALH